MSAWSPGATVSEVYSPPRMAPEAARAGLTPGTSYDLVTGWDLERADHQTAMWKQLAREKPALIILCLPCTAFSVV